MDLVSDAMSEASSEETKLNLETEAVVGGSVVSTTQESATTIPTKQSFTSALLPSQQIRDGEPISQNAFVSGSNMNGGCVMTGRPSSRVLAPPGGHSSIKLG
jgi:hypothetical protein